MIDVGQGDSILIEIPFRKEVYLIDTGGTVTYGIEKWQEKENPYSIGKDTILPYLKAKGIREISKLILTHPDHDHIGEAAELLESISVKELVFGNYHEATETELELLKIADEKGIRVKRVEAGDQWSVSEITFHVLAPFKEFQEKNNASIVLAAMIGRKSWLFTGDIEQEAEADLIKRYPKVDIDILKVAHHGSHTSSTDTFLSVTKPEVALISAGFKNRFGHPHPTIIEQLASRNISIYRTDQQGAIRFLFSTKKEGTFSTKLP